MLLIIVFLLLGLELLRGSYGGYGLMLLLLLLLLRDFVFRLVLLF